MRVLVADDHPIVREGLKHLIRDEFASSVIEETDSGSGAIAAIRAATWDVVILDIHLPDKNGLDVLKEAKSIAASLPVIVLSVYPEEQYALRAFKAGADAYLTKESAPYELVKAIKTVRNGHKYVKSVIADQLVGTPLSESPIVPHSLLSDRELEVLRMFSNGKAPKEIGQLLMISEKTVSTYRSRILMKLHLHTTVDLIRYALEQRLV
jgi:two-component system, NarL family, invasion response regulator UvrY